MGRGDGVGSGLVRCTFSTRKLLSQNQPRFRISLPSLLRNQWRSVTKICIVARALCWLLTASPTSTSSPLRCKIWSALADRPESCSNILLFVLDILTVVDALVVYPVTSKLARSASGGSGCCRSESSKAGTIRVS